MNSAHIKERPILFQGEMVRAILAGAKTQTRRAITRTGSRVWQEQFPNGSMGWVTNLGHAFGNQTALICRYGQPGDRLWVKESFWGCDLPGYGDQPCVVYDDEWIGKEYKPAEVRPWARKFGRIPSIHMPRDCSRILLEVTGVRVERLHAINRGDAMGEGCPFPNMAKGDDPRQWYADLWNSINGAGSWDANPWVWVVEFRRVEA